MAQKQAKTQPEIHAQLISLLDTAPDLVQDLGHLFTTSQLNGQASTSPQMWIMKLRAFIRTVVEKNRKLVGIGWGHHIICLSFVGGAVQRNSSAEPDRTRLSLTERGCKLFPWLRKWGRCMWLHEFHKHEITNHLSPFVSLAYGNKAFVSESNKIMTIQGHPELNQYAVMAVLRATPEYRAGDARRNWQLIMKMKDPGDGTRVWERILKWATE
jgi:GMP synthase-like glutamine amidotransferase